MSAEDSKFAWPIPEKALEALLWQARDYLASILRRPECEGCGGGYLVIRRASDDSSMPPVLTMLMGEVPILKAPKYERLACEKGRRLGDNLGNLSSWQTRQPEIDRYGGAVRGTSIILSFSGLPENADEALCTLVAFQCGRMSRTDAERVAEISDNQILRELLATA